MARITQIPTPPKEWLHDGAPDWVRHFTDYILIDDSLPRLAGVYNGGKGKMGSGTPAARTTRKSIMLVKKK